MYRTELSLLQKLLPFEAKVDMTGTVSLGTELGFLELNRLFICTIILFEANRIGAQFCNP